MVGEGGDDRRRLLQVFFDRVVVHIHVGVMRPGAVGDRLLDELKTREADRIE